MVTHPQPHTCLPTSNIDPEDLKSAVVDVAHRMAELCLDLGDTAGVPWAVTEPSRRPGDSNDLWVDLVRIEHDEGQDAAVTRTVTSMMAYRDCEDPTNSRPTCGSCHTTRRGDGDVAADNAGGVTAV